jgi:preprotein translocase subunit SecG
MYHFILVLHIIFAILLIGIILVQRSDSDGFGLGGGGNSLMAGRTSANLLTRTTAILATLFILSSLGLNYFGPKHKSAASIADQISATGDSSLDKPAEAPEAKPVPKEAPAVPKPKE